MHLSNFIAHLHQIIINLFLITPTCGAWTMNEKNEFEQAKEQA